MNTVKKIAIVGYTTTRNDAPFDDPEWEVWGMNNLHSQPGIDITKFDRWYDLHPVDVINQDPGHVEWLKKGMLPTYVWLPHEEWPSSIEYPRLEIEAQFGRYMTNSVSWMVAHAIEELRSRTDVASDCSIGVWGVDMATDSEYGSQRPSCEWMIGVAQGMGIKVVIPDQSDLLKTSTPYGVDNSPLRAKLTHRDAEMKQNLANLRQQEAQINEQLSQTQAHINQMIGAIESNLYILNVWTMPEVKRDDPNRTT